MRVLCADIGNSRTHLAIFPRAQAVPRIPARVDAVAYCSVSPRRERVFLRACPLRPVRLDRRNIPVVFPHGWTVGPDRLCNAAAAFDRFRRACIVVDAGTAINVEVVDRKGRLVAGVIAPGVGLMTRALAEHTAGLPRVRPDGRPLLGKDTEGNIRAGVDAAARGLIRETLARARGRVGRAPVIGTGGDAERFREMFDVLDPLLTLRGVYIAWTRLRALSAEPAKRRSR
jgi:type III pantothenate kinase